MRSPDLVLSLFLGGEWGFAPAPLCTGPHCGDPTVAPPTRTCVVPCACEWSVGRPVGCGFAGGE